MATIFRISCARKTERMYKSRGGENPPRLLRGFAFGHGIPQTIRQSRQNRDYLGGLSQWYSNLKWTPPLTLKRQADWHCKERKGHFLVISDPCLEQKLTKLRRRTVQCMLILYF